MSTKTRTSKADDLPEYNKELKTEYGDFILKLDRLKDSTKRRCKVTVSDAEGRTAEFILSPCTCTRLGWYFLGLATAYYQYNGRIGRQELYT